MAWIPERLEQRPGEGEHEKKRYPETELITTDDAVIASWTNPESRFFAFFEQDTDGRFKLDELLVDHNEKGGLRWNDPRAYLLPPGVREIVVANGYELKSHPNTPDYLWPENIGPRPDDWNPAGEELLGAGREDRKVPLQEVVEHFAEKCPA